jgi:hypothetical protein
MGRVLPLLGLALLLGLAGCKSKPDQVPAPGAPELKVKAGDLIKEYQANALAADGKYKGKTIELTGKFGSVQKAGLYGYALLMTPEDTSDENASSVLCILLPEAQDEAAKLKANDPVTLKGICDGPTPLGGPLKVNKCVFVK